MRRLSQLHDVGYIASRIYLKPLASHQNIDLDIDRVLKRTKRLLLKRLRSTLAQTTFSPQAKAALTRALSIEVKTSSLQIIAKHPAFRPLVEGQRRQQMKWLTKARAPIPIITETGKLIFRSATPRSMKDGKWWHPGRQPTNFVEKAKQQTREYIKDKLSKELAASIKARFTKNIRRLS